MIFFAAVHVDSILYTTKRMLRSALEIIMILYKINVAKTED